VLALTASVATGFALAYLLEPLWHRFIAHGKIPDPSREGHLEHHRRASEPVEVWRELTEHGARVIVTLAVLVAALAPLLGLACAGAAVAGLASGFVAVNFLHARMHHRAPRGRFEQWMWRFHWHHHAADARVNFGLTHPLVDFVLGTAVVPERVVVPPKLVPAWLRAAGGTCCGISSAR
jgi:sterol desaturase/sphingolipid hydroxylase (fatty acid hydroxylase superfamily)